jgi:hypothetical protein
MHRYLLFGLPYSARPNAVTADSGTIGEIAELIAEKPGLSRLVGASLFPSAQHRNPAESFRGL